MLNRSAPILIIHLITFINYNTNYNEIDGFRSPISTTTSAIAWSLAWSRLCWRRPSAYRRWCKSRTWCDGRNPTWSTLTFVVYKRRCSALQPFSSSWPTATSKSKTRWILLQIDTIWNGNFSNTINDTISGSQTLWRRLGNSAAEVERYSQRNPSDHRHRRGPSKLNSWQLFYSFLILCLHIERVWVTRKPGVNIGTTNSAKPWISATISTYRHCTKRYRTSTSNWISSKYQQ